MTNVPAVIGRTVDGKEHVIKAGISVRDLKSGIDELKSLLESFERKNKKVAASYKSKKQSQPDQPVAPVPLLSVSNFNNVCGEKVAVCVIGVFRSSKSKEMLEKILIEVISSCLLDDSFVRVGFTMIDHLLFLVWVEIMIESLSLLLIFLKGNVEQSKFMSAAHLFAFLISDFSEDFGEAAVWKFSDVCAAGCK